MENKGGLKMNVSIWNKVTKKWIPTRNINNIFQCRGYFEINFDTPDAKKYDTDKYELTFVHSGVIQK